jgi:DNA recombination protein RmuC
MIYAAIIALVAGFGIGYYAQKNKTILAQKEAELLKQQIEQIKNIKDSASAQVLEVSQIISSKLLEDHKRENEQSKKQSEESTNNIQKEFAKVVEKLAAIDGQNKHQEQKISAIWQGLISPVKAANFAEIGLENTLKSFGLEQGRDFITQNALEGTRLKPDAVINLPGGNVMVIDAKTSSFFVEETDKLKQTMNKHLQDLAGKDYAASVKTTGNVFVVNVMYLPSEAALTKALEADSSFSQKCIDNGIILASPSSLQLLLHIANHHIATSRQEQNYRVILKEMGKVISSLDNYLRGLEKVGNSLKSTVTHFTNMAGPINSRLLPRIKRLIDMGVEPESQAKLPANIPNFNLIEQEVIEGEAEVVQLEKKVG